MKKCIIFLLLINACSCNNSGNDNPKNIVTDSAKQSNAKIDFVKAEMLRLQNELALENGDFASKLSQNPASNEKEQMKDEEIKISNIKDSLQKYLKVFEGIGMGRNPALPYGDNTNSTGK